MGPDQTHDPWISNQTHNCSRYVTQPCHKVGQGQPKIIIWTKKSRSHILNAKIICLYVMERDFIRYQLN